MHTYTHAHTHTLMHTHSHSLAYSSFHALCAVVLQRLQTIEAEGVIAKMDEPPPEVDDSCGCAGCSVM